MDFTAGLAYIFVHIKFLIANCWKFLNSTLLLLFSLLDFMMASDTDVKVTSAKELVGYSWSCLLSAVFPVSIAICIPVVKAAWNYLQGNMKKSLMSLMIST